MQKKLIRLLIFVSIFIALSALMMGMRRMV
jgi:hypothetical protein